ncbi:hypothetical protein HAX54_007668, partial [Datura stramonium]|nr:hypothetical protein [Datura stramonium]
MSKVSIITTHYNALGTRPPLMILAISLRPQTQVPIDEVGLQKGLRTQSAINVPREIYAGVWMGIALLQKSIEDLIVELRPHCVVWACSLVDHVEMIKRIKESEPRGYAIIHDTILTWSLLRGALPRKSK